MNYAETRGRIRAIIFAITGFVEAFIFLRICLDLISANPNNALVSLISQITNPLISPFDGLVTLPQSGILVYLNINAIIAFIVYILAAIAISEIITAFIYEHFKDIFQNIVDAIFKFVEAFLILRIVFELFGVGLTLNSPQFVKFIYGSTEWSQGLIFNQPFLGGRINFSAILCLVIVVIIDLLTERFLDSVFTQISTIVKKTKISVPKIEVKNILPAKKEPSKPAESNAPKPQSVQQNIIINVPVPQPGSQPVQPQVTVQNGGKTPLVNINNVPVPIQNAQVREIHDPKQVRTIKGPDKVKEG